jgi:hypothetical protein
MKDKVMAATFLILAFCIPNVEFMRSPIAHVTFQPLPTSIVEMIRAEPPDIAVLTDQNPAAEFEVMLHHHPISYARQSRIPMDEYQALHQGLFNALIAGASADMSGADVEAIMAYLRENHFKYAIFHGFSQGRQEFFENHLNARRLFFDERFQIYQLYN